MPWGTTEARQAVRRAIHDAGTQAAYTGHMDLSDAQIDDCVTDALVKYNMDRPTRKIVEITGDGTKFYPISGLTGYVEGESAILDIQYPAVYAVDGREPEYLDLAHDMRLHEQLVAATRTLYLYFPNHTPKATEKIRVGYTIPTTLDLVRTVDQTTLVKLAASFACLMMASKYAKEGNSTLQIDHINYADKGRRWRQLAEEFEAKYWVAMGYGRQGQPKPHSAFVDWDTGNSYDTLFHYPRSR